MNEIIKCYIPYDRFTDKITGIELILNMRLKSAYEKRLQIDDNYLQFTDNSVHPYGSPILIVRKSAYMLAFFVDKAI